MMILPHTFQYFPVTYFSYEIALTRHSEKVISGEIVGPSCISFSKLDNFGEFNQRINY